MNLDNAIRNLIVGLIFFVPFIPFIVSNTMFFPFITGKNFTFRIVVEIMLGLYAILALRSVLYRPQFSWILIGATAFVAIIGIADLFGANPVKSFWSNFERMEGYVTLLHLFAYFVIVGSVLKTREIWNWLLHTSVAASVIMGLYALWQKSGGAVINQGGVRVDGKFGNATYLAVYMLFHIFITAILLARWRGGNFIRALYGITILLQIVILFFTATRGSILGALGGLFLSGILIVILERKNKLIRNIGVGIFAAIIAVVGIFFVAKDTEFVQTDPTLSRFATLTLDSGTAGHRFTIWGMAWEGVKERPLLGWGQENFNLVFNERYEAELWSAEPWFDRVHNIFFDWMIAGGILGMLGYFSIPILIMYYLWFRRSEEFSNIDKALITGLLAGYFFHNLFVFDNVFSYIMYFTIVAYVYSMTAHPRKEEGPFSRPVDSGMVDRVAMPLILIATVFVIYFTNSKGILASQTLIQALRPQPDPALNITIFREALAFDSKIGNQEIREQLVQGSARAAGNNGLTLESRQELFNLAVGEMEKHIEEFPGDARHELFLASLYDTYGQAQIAESHFVEAQRLSPHKQSIRFAYAGNLINQSKFEEAIVLLEETAELDPEYAEGHIMHAVALIYAGRSEADIDDVLGRVSEAAAANSGRLLQAYNNIGEFEKVKDLLETKVANRPNDTQAKISLAAAYLQLEMREEAIGAIQAVIDQDPGFADQGNFLISEIRAGRNP